MDIVRYNKEYEDVWNGFVAGSKNGTFLLDRRFMDYHSDRFSDSSLLFYERGKLVAVLPANFDADSRTVYSHQGLTYGGLIMSFKLTMRGVMEAFDLMLKYFREVLHAETFIYKPIPYIYNRYASEEDLYALFRHGATLKSRGISSCIHLQHRIPVTESRKSGLRKATGIVVRETDDVERFWKILNGVLSSLHHTHPVHSVDELKLLMSRFPDKIKLFGAFRNDNENENENENNNENENDNDNEMLAGSLVFDFGYLVHTQYLASTNEGKSLGALDKVIMTLISDFYSDREYLDFGISTEDGGRYLNEGLIFQKEGFGGRGICYDCYEVRW